MRQLRLQHKAAEQVKQRFPHIIMEASGGIREGNIRDYFSPHIDVISMGSLTQGYPVVDFSMKIQKQ
jgi:nicotinate-nucleotide pyrophosphorylase (carboxylating)